MSLEFNISRFKVSGLPDDHYQGRRKTVNHINPIVSKYYSFPCEHNVFCVKVSRKPSDKDYNIRGFLFNFYLVTVMWSPLDIC